jgi:hypothetical protein
MKKLYLIIPTALLSFGVATSALSYVFDRGGSCGFTTHRVVYTQPMVHRVVYTQPVMTTRVVYVRPTTVTYVRPAPVVYGSRFWGPRYYYRPTFFAPRTFVSRSSCF